MPPICGFVLHHRHSLSQRGRAKSHRDCHATAHGRSHGDWCSCCSSAGLDVDRMTMAHCHLRQVDKCGDMPRASQKQGKCRVSLKFCPLLQLSPCSLWRAARVKLGGMGCVPYSAKWNSAYCVWQKSLSGVLQTLNGLHKEQFFTDVPIVYFSCSPCQLMKGKKKQFWFHRK